MSGAIAVAAAVTQIGLVLFTCRSTATTADCAAVADAHSSAFDVVSSRASTSSVEWRRLHSLDSDRRCSSLLT